MPLMPLMPLTPLTPLMPLNNLHKGTIFNWKNFDFLAKLQYFCNDIRFEGRN